MTTITVTSTLIFNTNYYTLDGTVVSPFTYSGQYIIASSNPANTITVSFGSNITISNSSFYLTSGNSNIIYDGKGNSINMTVNAYRGLIRSTFGNITIQNLGITGTGTLAQYGGWILQGGCNNAIIKNCYNTCSINSGTQNNGANGGICGGVDNVTIEYCYNTGPVGGWGASGICAGGTNNVIKNCYNTGSIGGASGSGILTSYGNTSTIENCYNLGTCSPNGDGYGICSNNGSNVLITNCYSLYGLIGLSIKKNCYEVISDPARTWSDSAANTALANTPTSIYNAGSVWTSIATNTPYVLSQFITENSYNPNFWEQSSGDSYTTGPISTILFPKPTYSYNLLSVNNSVPSSSNATFDSNNGVITFSSLTYTTTQEYKANVFISQGISPNYIGYTFSPFTLTTSNLQQLQQEIASNYKILITSTSDYVDDSNSPQPLPPFPITIVNENPNTGTLVVSFAPGITYSSASNYFICGTNNITFDGLNNPIIVTGTGWQGLIQNGTGSDAKSNITVQNIIINNNSASLSTNSGWVCQSNFGKGGTNNKIFLCNTTA